MDQHGDQHSAALAQAIEEVLPGWVERSVAAVLARAGPGAEPEAAAGAGSEPEAQASGVIAGPVLADAADAGRRAAAEVGAAVRELLAADIDEQRSTPLTLLRQAVRYPTEVLRRAGVAPVEERDDVKVRLFPDDVYDLSPATFGDVDPRLAEPGLLWGAAKAFAHRQRHQPKET